MTTRASRPAASSNGKPMACVDATLPAGSGRYQSGHRPLPPSYVPPSPSQATTVGLLWRTAVRAARLAGGWAVRHWPQRGSAGPAAKSQAALAARARSGQVE